MTTLAPGSTIGIIGGGQLGRMTAVAAAELGYKCHVYCPEDGSPAFQVCDTYTCAPYEDHDALKAFAQAVDVVTFEFENIPAESVELLESLVPVRPNGNCLRVAQDRVIEKSFFNDNACATAPWREVSSAEELKAAIAAIGAPSILKTTRFGYDGKGQVRILPETHPEDAWNDLNADVGILEGFVDFTLEISVIVARSANGEVACFEPVENRHSDGILDVTIAPAAISPELAAKATHMAETVAGHLDLIGLLAIEMFVTKDGDILVNEMAPRPHNSGHWTQDGAITSQFEQFVRAVCGLPLGNPARHSDTVMKNLIGNDALAWDTLLATPDNKLHLYGKAEPRPGRKMGHVNRCYPKGSQPDDWA